MQCNECDRWVHSRCEGIDQAQYESMTQGTHPVWGAEYLCPICRVSAAERFIDKLSDRDITQIFSYPVTESVAATYYDVIRNPMDLETMRSKASRGQYKSLQSLRQDFELMCLNALVFNQDGDEYWQESKTFFDKGLKLFEMSNRRTSVSTFGVELNDMLQAIVTKAKSKKDKEDEQRRTMLKEQNQEKEKEVKARYYDGYYKRNRPSEELPSANPGPNPGPAETRSCGDNGNSGKSGIDATAKVSTEEEEKATSEKRLQVDKEKDTENEKDKDTYKDLKKPKWDLSLQQKQADVDIVTDTQTVEVELPSVLTASPDPPSGYAAYNTLMTCEDAFYQCALDQCMVCASSGASHLFLMCIDCGECFHSFCVDAPFSSMSHEDRQKWSCYNCKVCEHCGVASDQDASEMVLCNECDRGFHGLCLDPPLSNDRAREADVWICSSCLVCVEPDCNSANSAIYIKNSKKNDKLVVAGCSTDTTGGSTDAAGGYSGVSHWGTKHGFCFGCESQKENAVKKRFEYLKLAEFDAYQSLAACTVCDVDCSASYISCKECKRPSHASCALEAYGADITYPWPLPHLVCSSLYENMYTCAGCANLANRGPGAGAGGGKQGKQQSKGTKRTVLNESLDTEDKNDKDMAIEEKEKEKGKESRSIEENLELHTQAAKIARTRVMLRARGALNQLSKKESHVQQDTESHRRLLISVIRWASCRIDALLAAGLDPFIVSSETDAYLDPLPTIIPPGLVIGSFSSDGSATGTGTATSPDDTTQSVASILGLTTGTSSNGNNGGGNNGSSSSSADPVTAAAAAAVPRERTTKITQTLQEVLLEFNGSGCPADSYSASKHFGGKQHSISIHSARTKLTYAHAGKPRDYYYY